MYEQTHDISGLKLYTCTNKNLNSFCLALYVRAGSIFEQPENNGISHLLEHVVFRNLNIKYNEQLYDLLSLNGLSFKGGTYKEFIQFSIEGPVFGFAFACEIISGIFDEIKISGTEFKYEKGRIKAEIREGIGKYSLRKFFLKNVWEETNNNKTILGYCRVLDNTSLRKINAFKTQVLSTNNCFVYLTGNASDENINLLKDKLEKQQIKSSEKQNENIIYPTHKFFNRENKIKVMDSSYCAVYFGFDVDTQKYSGGLHDILYRILFCDENALLYMQLSETNPLIYSYDSYYEQYDNVSNLQVTFDIAPEKLEEGISRVVDLLNDTKCGKYNFEANLKRELALWIMSLDNPSELNWNMAYHNHIFKSPPAINSLDDLSRFTAVTSKQIMQAATDIFRRENLTLVIEGNKRKVKTENIENILKRLG